MIFSELYSAYYNAVADILRAATDHPVEKPELLKIIKENTFGESVLNIEPALDGERWQIMHPDGTTPIRFPPSMPLTTLQKRWLQTLSMDPRIRLFTDTVIDYGVEPLFQAEDYAVFDRYSDGDPYEDERYIKNFRVILDAIHRRIPLVLDVNTRKGKAEHFVVMPEYLEYSEKDDKFRLIASGNRHGRTVNLEGIVGCKSYSKPFVTNHGRQYRGKHIKAELVLTDQRNSLERVLLHFAHFEKEAVKLEDGRYRITITYEKDDETELIIRILSFGPMLKVTAPQGLVNSIKDRLKRQKRLTTPPE